MSTAQLSLIRGGRYGEPVPAKAPPEAPPPEKERSLGDCLGPMPEERAWLARAADSPFARFDHDKVGA
jgi:hypothetical protein